MIFSPVRTQRLQLELKELTIGDSIDLCEMSEALNEAGTTRALRSIIKSECDPRMMTVQERAFVICMYIANTGHDPNFAIGKGTLSDYILDRTVEKAWQFGHGGSQWVTKPMLGIHAEAIERLILKEQIPAKRHAWWTAAMAAMLSSESKPEPDWNAMSDIQVDEYILKNYTVLREYPESEFMALLGYFSTAVKEVDHLFRLDFQDYGIAFSAREGSAAELPPARFHFNSIVAEDAFAAFGNAE